MRQRQYLVAICACLDLFDKDQVLALVDQWLRAWCTGSLDSIGEAPELS
jgi:hypothetical protein